MSRLRSALEDLLIYIGGTVMVLGMCALYVVCRICGVRWGEEF